MKFERKLLFAALAFVAVFSLFGVSVFAGKGEKQNPLDAVWAAISDLQDQINGIQSLLDARAPQMGALSISPADFDSQYIDISISPGMVFIESGSEYLCLYAPVHLPQGVKVTGMGLYAYDVSADGCRLRLHKITYKSQVHFYPVRLASVSSTDNPSEVPYSLSITNIASTEEGYEIIDNTDGSYFVDLHIPSGEPLRFYSAFIEYEYPE